MQRLLPDLHLYKVVRTGFDKNMAENQKLMLYLHYKPPFLGDKTYTHMKKTAILLAAFAVLFPAALRAQVIEPEELLTEDLQIIPAEKPKPDDQIFTHLALGVTFLNPSTIVLPNVATTITPYVQVRAGLDFIGTRQGGFWPLLTVSNFYKTPITLPNIQFGDNQYDIQVDGTVNMSELKVLFDFFPGKRTGFHFTAGFFWDVFSGGNFAEVYTAKPFLPQSDWQTLGVTFKKDPSTGDYQYRLATDDKGMLKLNLHTNPFRPYIGIGFGRAIRPDKRVRVTFDLGAFYIGGFKVQADVQQHNSLGGWDTNNLVKYTLTSADTAEFNSSDPSKPLDEFDISGIPVVNSLFADENGMVRITEALNKIKFSPYAQLHLYIRIF